MYWSIDTNVSTNDVVVRNCGRVRDAACWVLLAVLVVLALISPFMSVGVPGAVVLVIAIFFATSSSIVVLIISFLRPRRKN